MPQLDSVRGIAISLVLIGHFGTTLAGNFGFLFLMRFLNTFGQIGVRLFFVLSGFLITGILLRSRELPKRQAFKLFYTRRFIRIFPIYYLLLAILLMTNLDGFRADAWWHVLYGTNFLVAHLGWEHGQATSHFWSLAVEEQFYLIWPLLVLFLSLRKLKWVIVATVFGSVGFRILGTYYFRWGHTASQVLLPGCLDSLGLGALLAFNDERTFKHLRYLAYVFAPLLGLIMVLKGFDCGADLYQVFYEISIAACSAVFVYAAASGIQGLTGRVMMNPTLQYIGVISYAIYLFHIPIYVAVHQRIRITLVVCLFLAIASRYLIEKPLNRLKRKFEYPLPVSQSPIDSTFKPECVT
jgi:peptidoglycan/LPS O-acetylase OafA/YrhL